MAAGLEERRRVVRDLHEGAQQSLVNTVITLKAARRSFEDGDESLDALLTEALDQAQLAAEELRELAHGVLPAVLTFGGLRAGIAALASRSRVPIEVGVSVGRLPVAVEAIAYLFVAEALTNVAKHAHATSAAVTASVSDHTLHVQVRDNGIGGASREDSGLIVLGDRLAALDGQLRVESPPGAGTTIAAEIPVGARASRALQRAARGTGGGTGMHASGAATHGTQPNPECRSADTRN